MPGLNTNIKVFNLYAQSLKLYICILRLVPKGASRWPQEANISPIQEGWKEEPPAPPATAPGLEPADRALLGMKIYICRVSASWPCKAGCTFPHSGLMGFPFSPPLCWCALSWPAGRVRGSWARHPNFPVPAIPAPGRQATSKDL